MATVVHSTHTHMFFFFSLSLSLSVYIYIYICVCIVVGARISQLLGKPWMSSLVLSSLLDMGIFAIPSKKTGRVSKIGHG